MNRRRLSGVAAFLLAFIACGTATPAMAAKTEILPYIELQQVVTAELDNGGDVLTYTAVAAGVDGRVRTRRVEAQISYRYERRIAWDKDLADNDVHSGLAQARIQVVPNALSLDAGALAARSRTDGSGPAFAFAGVDDARAAEVYSLYAGPTLSTRVGPLSVGAAYRLGYVHVDDNVRLAGADPAGRLVLDRFDSSVSHDFTASIGMGPGELPFGWTLGGGYVREDLNRLDQRFEGGYVRGDVVVPVGPTLALTGGVGYEDMEASQRDILRDANGLPVLTTGGRLIADKTKPRLLAYDQSGLIWDVGVIWRPSRHTELQARGGRRYGGTTVTGSFEHKFNSRDAVRAEIYDGVSSFGRVLVDDLSGLPTNFEVNHNPLGQNVGGIGGCVFGEEAGTGVCFDNALQSIGTSNFRMRGANILFSGRRGPWSFGLGANYVHRNYLAPRLVPGGFSLDDVTDENISVGAHLGRALSRTSHLGLDAHATWYDSGIAGTSDAFGAGVSASYYRTFLFDRLRGQAAIGLFTTDSGADDTTALTGLIGLRYTF
ncbi:hypothetical protein [Allosphingosinicella humi]